MATIPVQYKGGALDGAKGKWDSLYQTHYHEVSEVDPPELRHCDKALGQTPRQHTVSMVFLYKLDPNAQRTVAGGHRLATLIGVHWSCNHNLH
jgi:hypothetical protein